MTSPNWTAAYAEIRPAYEVYEKKLRDLVTTILEHAKIDVVQVEGRVKTLDSFVEKIGRKSGKYADPLKDMTDLVGMRIIAYYVEDVDRIVELLRNEFEAIDEHSTNKQSELAPDQFGYTSNHLIVRIGRRSAWPEWAKYSDIAVEFQVRTTLQHAWAAVNHKLSYKRVEDVPTSLQRSLFRLSALFELADEQFSAIRRAASTLSDEYTDNVKRGNLDIKIDANSIDAYLQNSAKVQRIVSMAREFGPELDFAEGTAFKQGRSHLILIAQHFGATTIEDFDQLLPDELTTRRVLKAVEAVFGKGDADELPHDREPAAPAGPHSVYVILGFMVAALHGVSKDFFDVVIGDNEDDWNEYAEVRARLGSQDQGPDSPRELSR